MWGHIATFVYYNACSGCIYDIPRVSADLADPPTSTRYSDGAKSMCPIFSVPYSTQFIMFGQQPGSSAFDFALRLRDVAWMLEVFENDSIRRILRVRRRDCVPPMELRHRLCLKSMPALLVQRRLRWFDHATKRPEGELIKDLLLPTLPRTGLPSLECFRPRRGQRNW